MAYKPSDLAQAPCIKDANMRDQILDDLAAALAWLRQHHLQASIHVVGFCFGGDAAFPVATSSEVSAAFDFYVAGLSRMRPGGGEPSLALMPEIRASSPASSAQPIPRPRLGLCRDWGSPTQS